MPDTSGAAPAGAAGAPAPKVSILDQGDLVHEPTKPVVTRPQKTERVTSASEPPRERPEDEEIDPPAGGETPLEEPDSAAEGDPGGDEEGEAAGEAEAESSEGEEPESEAEKGRQTRSDKLERLRDGREVTIGELKRTYEERTAWEARLNAEFQARVRDIDAQRQYFHQSAQQYQQQLQQAVAQAQAVIPPEPDLALRETDPFRYQQEWVDRERAIRQYHARNQQLEHVKQQQQAQTEHQFQSILAQQTEAFFAKAPELRAPEKMKAFRKEAHEVLGKAYGLQPQEIDGSADHRFVLAMRDLVEFQKLKATRDKNKDVLKQKTAGAPPVQRPSAQTGLRPSAASRDARNVQELRRIQRDPNASQRDKQRAGEALLSRYS